MSLRLPAALQALAFSAAACAQSPISATPPPAPLFSKSPVPFALLRQSWIEDLEAHRLLASLAHYAPEADFLPAQGGRIHGTAALRQLYTAIFKRFDADIHFTSSTTGASGDLAYDSGSYDETITDNVSHAAVHLEGQYVTIYRRTNLQWLIVQQAFTASAAPAPAAK